MAAKQEKVIRDVQGLVALLAGKKYLHFASAGHAEGRIGSAEIDVYASSRELGLEIRFPRYDSGRLFISVDTDLHEIQANQFGPFEELVVSEMVDVLSAVEEERVLYGTRRGRPAIAINLMTRWIAVFETFTSIVRVDDISLEQLSGEVGFIERTT